MIFFSFLDLLILYNAGGVANNPNTFIYGLTTSNGIYFIKIDDMNAYSLWLLTFTNLGANGQRVPNERAIDMSNTYKDDYGIDEYSSPSDAMDAFMRYLSDNNTGLGFMRYNESMGGFEKLRYNLNNIISERCPGVSNY